MALAPITKIVLREDGGFILEVRHAAKAFLQLDAQCLTSKL
jgi:hypothetical protein